MTLFRVLPPLFIPLEIMCNTFDKKNATKILKLGGGPGMCSTEHTQILVIIIISFLLLQIYYQVHYSRFLTFLIVFLNSL